MAILEIPLTAAAQSFLINLSGQSYRMTVTYRECLIPYTLTRAGNQDGFPKLLQDDLGGWILDIAAGDGGPLLSGVPLLPGEDLLGQHRHLGFRGSLLVITDGAPDEAPTYANLGAASRLYYVTDNDPAV